MKINKMDNIQKIYNNMEVNKVKANKGPIGKDEVELSEKAKDYQIGMKKLKEIPDIREDKVERIKKQIKSGTYNVKGQEIAEKILENILLDKRI
ncbi:MAG: flagellar biosynthesis anti-sigma factor FlgM [Tissierellia bacterium]|nr:flagellar biosynthesis anti-sigma factor FlgM [Tissierellia bacterium]